MSRVRITGGAWRSRLISIVDTPGLRPTPDRVRETLFNWLGQDLSGWTCLDLFAGSGVLGFEAASRGAASVDLVERDRLAFEALRRNAEAFSDARLTVWRADALEFAAAAVRRDRRYDLVLLDPPYRQGWLETLWPSVTALVAAGGRIYAEAEHALMPPESWRVFRQGRAGQVYFHLLGQE